MSYESEPLYKIIKITKADVFAAVCLGLFVGAVLWTMTSSALSTSDLSRNCASGGLSCPLSVQPSQELGKTMLHGQTLEVKPASITKFNQVSEPNDIQPAMGRNMEQRTYNPQSGYNGTVYRVQLAQ